MCQDRITTGDDTNKFGELTMTTSVKWYEIPPIQKRTQLLKECHDNFHIGTKAMPAQFHSQKITWNKIQLDVYNFCKLCEQRQMKNPDQVLYVVVADRPLQHLYIRPTWHWSSQVNRLNWLHQKTLDKSDPKQKRIYCCWVLRGSVFVGRLDRGWQLRW